MIAVRTGGVINSFFSIVFIDSLTLLVPGGGGGGGGFRHDGEFIVITFVWQNI